MQNERVTTEGRIVVDESSFAFNALDNVEVERALDDFNDTLSSLLRSGISVSKFSLVYQFECRIGLPLYSLLYEKPAAVDVDTLRRLSDLLQRCADWDDHTDDVDPSCQLDGASYESWSLAYIAKFGESRFMAALSFSHSPGAEVHSVATGGKEVEVFFLITTEQIPLFWQQVIHRDQLAEKEFFALAERAYITLYLHPDLNFSRFHGSYTEVYPWVANVLSVLDRHFARSFAEHSGVRNLIQSDMNAHGVDISPESRQTRQKSSAMSERAVTVDSISYKCEWHAKRLWNVDRIHFSVPAALPDGRTLIGIFVDHLST